MKDYRKRIIAVAALVGMLATLFLIVPAQAAPTVQILSPANGSTVSGTVTIEVKCTDTAGLDFVDIKAGNYRHTYVWQNAPTNANAQFSWNTSKEKNGFTYIEAICYNVNAGRTVDDVGVTIKNVKPPAVIWQAPPSPSYFKDTVSSTQLKCLIKKGQGTAIRKVQVFIDNKYKTQTYYSPPKNGLSFTWTYSLNLKSLSLGKHIITVRAYNTSGGHAEAKGTIYRRH
jgi:thermitase